MVDGPHALSHASTHHRTLFHPSQVQCTVVPWHVDLKNKGMNLSFSLPISVRSNPWPYFLLFRPILHSSSCSPYSLLFSYSTYFRYNQPPMSTRSDVGQGLDQLDGDDSDAASNASSNRTQGRQTYLWSNYSIPQLRELLRQRGQLTTGSKSAMKKRLKTLDRTQSNGNSTPSSPVVSQTASAAATHPSSSMMTQAGPEATPAKGPRLPTMTATTLDVRVPTGTDADHETPKKIGTEGQSSGRAVRNSHPFRTRGPTRSNSFSAHFAGKDEPNVKPIATMAEGLTDSIFTHSFYSFYLRPD